MSGRAKVILKGLDPIDMLYEIYFISRDRSLEVKDDVAASYLSVAGKAAADIAKYIYPTLSAVKFEEVKGSEKAMEIKQAMQVIMEDPFTKAALSAMVFQDNKQTLERQDGEKEAERQIAQLLPSGETNDGKGLAETYKPKKVKL